ncbi:MAG: hypothetical protein JEZ00_16420 [Anaerolineaceae bacterium]|nr:hypothetical protein [Anaerolineaceae bacterium]
MSLLSRYIGKKVHNASLIVNAAMKMPNNLQVLLFDHIDFTDLELMIALRAFDRSLSSALCKHDETNNQGNGQVYLLGWQDHVIRLVRYYKSMPGEVVEPCILVSDYSHEMKEKARNHKGYINLDYVGYDSDPLQQYAALAAVAGTLVNFGALVVLNQSARTSLPVATLAKEDRDKMRVLRGIAESWGR